MRPSKFFLLTLLSTCMAAGQQEGQDVPVKVVKVAVINGKRFILKEMPEEKTKSNWQTKSFSPLPSEEANKDFPSPSKEQSANHHHQKRHGHHHGHHHHHYGKHGHHHRRHGHHHGHHHHHGKHRHHHPRCPYRPHDSNAPRGSKPSFIKVVVVKENAIVNQRHETLFKEIETTTSLYMQLRNKPVHKISTSKAKVVLVDNTGKQTEGGKEGLAFKAASIKKTPTEAEQMFVFFLLGMCSMLGFMAFYKGVSYLLSKDDDNRKGGYNKLEVDENKILLNIEEKGAAVANQV